MSDPARLLRGHGVQVTAQELASPHLTMHTATGSTSPDLLATGASGREYR